MPERPLLLFPRPVEAERGKLGSGFPKFHRPSAARQGEKFSPVFAELQKVFQDRNLEVQQHATGLEPEQVLVIETVGSVDAFAKAARRIDGFEWLSEFDVDGISPDPDFYDFKKPGKDLAGRLYFVMTNQRAMQEMVSLWERYQKDPCASFDRGFAGIKNVFKLLKALRYWDVEDRLLETGILESWEEDLHFDGEFSAPFEIELWFRGNASAREKSSLRVANSIAQLGGKVHGASVIEDIAYHGMLAELPKRELRPLIEGLRDIDLLKCEQIMYLRPNGQMVSDSILPDAERPTDTGKKPMPAGDPVVALLDGMPLANHSCLQGRLQIFDPDQWADDYPAHLRVHGTSMASMIIHGDLNAHMAPMERPLYIRPMLRPNSRASHREEFPRDQIILDLIHEATRDIFESPDLEGSKSQIRIINLSIGDKCRQFALSMSPLARLLDWLSYRYSVLFVVSAGNHAEKIELPFSFSQAESLSDGELHSAVIEALSASPWKRRLLSPSESLNALTVGAVHSDRSLRIARGDLREIIPSGFPSPVSAIGSGFRRSVKPDLVCSGGKILYRIQPSSAQSCLMPITMGTIPGIKSASPSPVVGEQGFVYSCGTSGAAALTSRAGAFCYDELIRIIGNEPNMRPFEVPLLKAMLVHSCTWGDVGDDLQNQLRRVQPGREKDVCLKWMGYGCPDFERVLECTPQRVTIVGHGALKDGSAHLFSLPLPNALASEPIKRRLSVTLAWLSPVSVKTQKYRDASLWFDIKNGFVDDRDITDWQAVRRGTLQHEIFTGQKAEPYQEGSSLEIKVHCRSEAKQLIHEIPYGIVVSLEVVDPTGIAIYEEIRDRLAFKVKVLA